MAKYPAMRVKELIEKLSKFDGEAVIAVDTDAISDDWCYQCLTGIRTVGIVDEDSWTGDCDMSDMGLKGTEEWIVLE